MLDDEEAKRRIVAARTLRGLSQDQLDALGADYGLGKQELSRAERGEMPLTRARRVALATLLRLPVQWFEHEQIDELIRWPLQEGEPLTQPFADLLRALESDARARRQGEAAGREGWDGEGRPSAAGEGGAG